jgi:UDP-glucose 4-epimerase
VRKVVYASSSATFGTPDRLPITETTPQYPVSPYGITKMVGEHYLRYYKEERGLDFTALRYGNVYGPRQDPNGEAGVISIFIGKFLKHEGVLIYWDGDQTRDYVYVKDVAQVNVASLHAGSGGLYCIGTGVKTSVNEIHQSLVQISGFEAPVEHAPRRPGDARDVQYDPELAQRELGWTAQTKLIDGMRATYEYFERRIPV